MLSNARTVHDRYGIVSSVTTYFRESILTYILVSIQRRNIVLSKSMQHRIYVDKTLFSGGMPTGICL